MGREVRCRRSRSRKFSAPPRASVPSSFRHHSPPTVPASRRAITASIRVRRSAAIGTSIGSSITEVTPSPAGDRPLKPPSSLQTLDPSPPEISRRNPPPAFQDPMASSEDKIQGSGVKFPSLHRKTTPKAREAAWMSTGDSAPPSTREASGSSKNLHETLYPAGSSTDLSHLEGLKGNENGGVDDFVGSGSGRSHLEVLNGKEPCNTNLDPRSPSQLASNPNNTNPSRSIGSSPSAMSTCSPLPPLRSNALAPVSCPLLVRWRWLFTGSFATNDQGGFAAASRTAVCLCSRCGSVKPPSFTR